MQRRTLALALAATGLLMSTGPIYAQAGGATPAAPADSAHRMRYDPVGKLLSQRAELKLSDDQAKRLEAIRAKSLARTQGRSEEVRQHREARSKFRASMDSTRAEVMAVLTPEQETKVAAMRQQARAEWREKHGGKHGHRHEHGGHDDHRSDTKRDSVPQ